MRRITPCHALMLSVAAVALRAPVEAASVHALVLTEGPTLSPQSSGPTLRLVDADPPAGARRS
jgi:hypothetical protein